MDTDKRSIGAAVGQGVFPLDVDPRKVGRTAISPKRPPVETAGFADIFPYYAGFSFDWACAELKRHSNDIRQTVLDPWNGSGTTTLAAQYDGHIPIGVDLSPVANIIAQARCQLSGEVTLSSPPKRGRKRINVAQDPLLNWFDSKTVSRLRDWTESIRGSEIHRSAPCLLAIFRVIRKITNKFEGSNPTWVKRANGPDELLNLSNDELDQLINDELNFVAEKLGTLQKRLPQATIMTASASRLPLADSSVDLILTSPPYLTRIDYGVAYARELAVVGVDVFADRSLRSALMGTTLIRPSGNRNAAFGDVAEELLRKISQHASKASNGYYLKQAQQYMDDLSAGLDELTRVAKPGARACLVVQDSYYKDVHVPLAQICTDEASRRGWSVESVEPFPVIRSLMTMNRSAREYQKGDVSESVIALQMGDSY